jgi:hypothetical protein
LNSPRTLEACRRQGVNLFDLDPVTEDRVRKILSERKDKTASMRAVPQVLVEIRLKHYQDKRKELFRLIREVKLKIIEWFGEIGEVHDNGWSRAWE